MSAGPSLRERMAAAAADERVIGAVRLATWHKVDARAASMAKLRHYEALRERGAQIRQHALENLPQLLEQFVERVTARGASVHFAPDAEAACRIVTEIATARGVKLAVKSKSMTTEEVHLNDALAAAGVRVVETDLGEFIVQIDHDRPSHIITPIIHKDRRQIATAMARELGCTYTEDPTELTRIARQYLRDIFRRCDLGITGVNFGVAETGTLCLVTNEGNGRMTVTRPRVHVALMGIEKVIPRLEDLPVLLKLLARSSTGQPMGVYTTLISGPRRPEDVDGPEELHVVLLDNGRSDILAGPSREVLRCVRCGACLNACPVYRTIGGHAYGTVYAGPIGSVISPYLQPAASAPDLPFASSLCGACAEVCPVKIDLPGLLVHLRGLAMRGDLAGEPVSARGLQKMAMRMWAFAMRTPARYRLASRLLRLALRPFVRNGWIHHLPGPAGGWTGERDFPAPAKKTFRESWTAGLRPGPTR